jgi:flagellar hook-associated protein 3 FlgL
MRISTTAMHNSAIEAMFKQQSALSVTQSQVATGKKIQSPADDPIAAVHVLELQRAKVETDQYKRNSSAVISRLNHEEQALADVTLLVRRVHELTLQANNSTIDATSRASIASELSARAQELIDIANRRDGNGEFLFSGFATATQPFARSGATVNYAGDQGERVVQIGPTQRVADSHTGDTVFRNIREGNGTFVVSADNGNTGTGVITGGSVQNANAWVRDTYSIVFTAPDTWEVRDSAAALVATGAYASGDVIGFNGIQVNLTGVPAAGDNFVVAASQQEDMFATIDNIIDTLRNYGESPAERAQFATQIGASLERLNTVEQHALTVRAEVGSRLSMLDSVNSAREDFNLEIDRALSELQDVDYAEAISRMNRQLLGLQAAQQSYSQVARLSLFNYL